MRRTRAFEINLRTRELVASSGAWTSDPNALLLAPVPAPLGGALLVTDSSVIYTNGRASRARDMRRGGVCAFAVVDANRVLLGDESGALSLVTMTADSNQQV